MGNQESTPTHVIKKKVLIKKNQNVKPIPIIMNEKKINYNILVNNEIFNPKINQTPLNKNVEKKVEIKYENNYEDKMDKKRIDSNNKIMERSIISDIYINKNQNRIIDYPTNSNNQVDFPKNVDKIEFTPYNFKEEVDSFKNKISKEREEFENKEKERRKMFENLENNKKKYLEDQIKVFENKYNPWEILGLQDKDYNLNNIKKAYKKKALKYHPDKAGDKYQELFQLITQSYIYLLEKATEANYIDEKINKTVENKDYEDNINQKVDNIYLNKDNFDVNKFNKIFEEYKIPNSFDKGYGNLIQEDLEIDENEIFGKKFNNDIFNAHFDSLKKKKNNNEMVQFKEPDALDTSFGNLNQSFFGIDDIEDFGSVNNNGLCYTDYKKAHVDETLLIDANKVKFKTYKNIDQLESDRANISHTLSIEDKRRYEIMERKKIEDENYKLEQQKKYDRLIEDQYNKINQRLIVHK